MRENKHHEYPTLISMVLGLLVFVFSLKKKQNQKTPHDEQRLTDD